MGIMTIFGFYQFKMAGESKTARIVLTEIQPNFKWLTVLPDASLTDRCILDDAVVYIY